MPRPLSSQTSSNGTGRPAYAVRQAALMAPVAVEWLAEASPKLATAIASRGQAHETPSLADRSMETATPTARGRCDAMVDVCGMTASSW